MNYRNVSPSEAATMIKEKSQVIVLDIRTPKEFAEGHIEGAININFHDKDFESQLAALDKNKTYVMHCHSGGRSGKTIKVLKVSRFHRCCTS